MKASKWLLVLSILSLTVFSCKKKSDTDVVYKSLSGNLTVGELPAYVNPGDEFDLLSEGVSLPSSETDNTLEIIYTYKSSVDTKKDTTTSYHVLIPDIVGDYSIIATAELKGYYSKTVTLSTVIVGPKSISGCDKSTLATFKDGRDSKTYAQVGIGPQIWMAQNLAYFQKDSEGTYTFGQPYYGEKATQDVFGGFYSWEQAKTACPDGWRLPTVAEWESLGKNAGDLMVDAYYNGKRLWEFYPDMKINNKHQFFAMPFGYATIVDGEYSFAGFNDYAFFWADDSGKPICKYIHVSTPSLLEWREVSESDFAAQIRCVKE